MIDKDDENTMPIILDDDWISRELVGDEPKQETTMIEKTMTVNENLSKSAIHNAYNYALGIDPKIAVNAVLDMYATHNKYMSIEICVHKNNLLKAILEIGDLPLIQPCDFADLNTWHIIFTSGESSIKICNRGR